MSSQAAPLPPQPLRVVWPSETAKATCAERPRRGRTRSLLISFQPAYDNRCPKIGARSPDAPPCALRTPSLGLRRLAWWLSCMKIRRRGGAPASEQSAPPAVRRLDRAASSGWPAHRPTVARHNNWTMEPWPKFDLREIELPATHRQERGRGQGRTPSRLSVELTRARDANRRAAAPRAPRARRAGWPAPTTTYLPQRPRQPSPPGTTYLPPTPYRPELRV